MGSVANRRVSCVGRSMDCGPTVEFSRRARAARDDVKKATILRAKRSAATMGSAGWPVVSGCCQPTRTTPARNHAARRAFGGTTLARDHAQHNGRSMESPAARKHTCTTSVRWNYLPHTITPDMTGNPHHERSNHACTTSVPHNGLPNHTGTTSYQHHGRSYHASITRTGTTGTGTTGVEESPLIDIK